MVRERAVQACGITLWTSPRHRLRPREVPEFMSIAGRPQAVRVNQWGQDNSFATDTARAAQRVPRARSSGPRLAGGWFRFDWGEGMGAAAQLERHDGDVDVVELAEHPDQTGGGAVV
jgi:hypothetical protein